jgi:hypothetical protein
MPMCPTLIRTLINARTMVARHKRSSLVSVGHEAVVVDAVLSRLFCDFALGDRPLYAIHTLCPPLSTCHRVLSSISA